MTKTRNSGEKTKPQGRLFKLLAASVSLMAAAVPVVGAFEHWFSWGGSSGSTATSADYAKVCSLWDERHNEREGQLAQFRATFSHARNLTAARDALLLSANQGIMSISELQNDLEALTPGADIASVQRRVERDWKSTLAALRQYRERLRMGLKSATKLEEIFVRYPESDIEERTADARGQLLRLGGSACSLAQEREPPPVQWPPALQEDLAALNVPPAVPRHFPSRPALVAAKRPQQDSAPASPPETSASSGPQEEALPLPPKGKVFVE
jgi:hypothetical protein